MSKDNPKIFLISGPSGVGKDTIIEELRRVFDNFHFVITAVTRSKRSDEHEGINHFFISEKQFNAMIEKDELIEWSKVYKNFYGVPNSQLSIPMSEGKSVLLRVDVQGAQKIKKRIPNAISIFIKPESIDVIKKHLSSRGQNSEEEINNRIEAANGEIKLSNTFDYVITNQEGNIGYVIKEVKDIINKNL